MGEEKKKGGESKGLEKGRKCVKHYCEKEKKRKREELMGRRRSGKAKEN